LEVTEHPDPTRLFGLGSMLLLCVLLTAGVGGTWTLPKGTTPRIGLISLGKQDPNDASATARFDYFRVYRP
jgi:hypothetical protein